VPSTTAEPTTWEAERAELQSVLQSPLFVRSPALTHLLSYLCEKTFAGETDQIKEYSVAVDVFERQDSFDQDTDSIVRVQANRLRKRLGEYYAREGAGHAIHITIPVGQYVPSFLRTAAQHPLGIAVKPDEVPEVKDSFPKGVWVLGAVISVAVAIAIAIAVSRPTPKTKTIVTEQAQQNAEAVVGLPVGDEIHLLAGSSRKYVDHAGKVWSPDSDYSGGSAVSGTVQHIWRTLDPTIYRNSRQGDFAYAIPLKPGTYELRLHFAENLYGPESESGGGEGSRTMSVAANGQPLLRDFDVLADAGDGRTADVKIFSDISPARDGQLHLNFTSGKSGTAMVSGIEILPGVRGHLRPVRIAARDVPYYSNDSRWWSPDAYFKGGQLKSSQEPALGTDDPEFYETERWGHFSYAIPVTPGRYTVTMHFIEHHSGDSAPPSSAGQGRVFDVFCNGKAILSKLNIAREVGENRPLVRKIKGLEPNAQGKLLLEFVPVAQYATVTAIEVVGE
jgi:hypothetical protein